MLTDLGFLSKDQKWPPPSEQERLDMYHANTNLFNGDHHLVFTDWIRLLRDDQKATMELILNWHKRLSTLWADLLLGEPPKIKSGDDNEAVQQSLEHRVDQGFINTAYECALDVSRYGVGLLKIRYDGKAGLIEAIPASLWFPIVNPDNIKETTHHILAWPYIINDVKYVRVEIHEKGRITTKEILLNKDDKIVRELSSLEVQTNVDEFLIIPVNNLVTSDAVIGKDDYSDLGSLIQELEIRMAQISRILDKHADPSMSGPDTAMEIDPATGQAVFRAGAKFYPAQSGDPEMQYVVWNGQLEAAFTQIETLMEQLYVLSETSAAAFGQLKVGLAESGTALKRLMMAPLAKVNRIRMRFDPAIKNALKIVALLEIANGVPEATLIDTVHIEWQDGIPIDMLEQAPIETQLYAAGLTSLESSLKRLFSLEGDALTEEVDRIKKEKIENAPPPPVITMPGAKPKPAEKPTPKPEVKAGDK